MRLLAIDPGSTHSAYVVVDDDLTPKWFDKIANEELLLNPWLQTADHIAIEMVGHYGTGMSAGKDIFDTCIWIGRFYQATHDNGTYPASLVGRKQVVTHLCGSAKANDGNIRQALIDRFAPGQPNAGKGRKNDPGWFYGFHTDIWQAYALAVYWMDVHKPAHTLT